MVAQAPARARRRGTREGGCSREYEEPSEKGQGAREDEVPSGKLEKFRQRDFF